jgi:hypothetical protein
VKIERRVVAVTTQTQITVDGRIIGSVFHLEIPFTGELPYQVVWVGPPTASVGKGHETFEDAERALIEHDRSKRLEADTLPPDGTRAVWRAP